jgi:hypothetical protein
MVAASDGAVAQSSTEMQIEFTSRPVNALG